MIEAPPFYSHLLELWEKRAAELAAEAGALGLPRRLSDMTPQQRARYILDHPRPHGGGCPCASCVYNAGRQLEELLGAGWLTEYRRRVAFQRRIEKLR